VGTFALELARESARSAELQASFQIIFARSGARLVAEKALLGLACETLSGGAVGAPSNVVGRATGPSRWPDAASDSLSASAVLEGRGKPLY
jgi:hypothetical protein